MGPVDNRSVAERQRISSRAALLPREPFAESRSDIGSNRGDDGDDGFENDANGFDATKSLRRIIHPSMATMQTFNTTKSEVETSKKAYIYAIGIALPISLICFTIQTELAQYIQAKLHYEKPYFMLYITHGSWWLNGVGMWAFLRLRAGRGSDSKTVFRRMWIDCVETGRVVAEKSGVSHRNLAGHMLLVVFLCGVCLTIAGGTWYVAVNLTTAADLSAIYNSSAFFAYAFSIPILHERMRLDKILAVALSILGVLVIAYGDRDTGSEGSVDGGKRALGNIIISFGAILYGLYEVLYKKYGCPPDQYDPRRSVIFANAIATGLGLFTLTVMWIPIPILHILGWETFEFPPRQAALALFLSIASNFIYSSCLLAMISLTSPVLSSVACLLSIFVVAIVDTHVTGDPLTFAAIAGGLLISVGFAVLSWATYIEMRDDAKARMETENDDFADILSSDEDDD